MIPLEVCLRLTKLETHEALREEGALLEHLELELRLCHVLALPWVVARSGRLPVHWMLYGPTTKVRCESGQCHVCITPMDGLLGLAQSFLFACLLLWLVCWSDVAVVAVLLLFLLLLLSSLLLPQMTKKKQMKMVVVVAVVVVMILVMEMTVVMVMMIMLLKLVMLMMYAVVFVVFVIVVVVVVVAAVVVLVAALG